jgi:hypothetical protein
VAEIDAGHFFIGAGQGSQTFEIVDHQVIFFYRQIPYFAPDPQGIDLPCNLPVIEAAAVGIEQAQPLAPVFDRGIQLQTVVGAAQENIYLPIPLQVREDLHCPADMAIACCLYCVKDLHGN